MSWSRVNLREVEDQAAKHGFGEFQEARFPRRELGAEQTGFGHIVVKPEQRQPFSHRHGTVEEFYVVLSGSGTLKLDDELVELSPMDVVRIGPGVAHGMEAGADGLEVLAFGPLGDGDAEMVEGLWEDPEGSS